MENFKHAADFLIRLAIYVFAASIAAEFAYRVLT